MKELNQFEQWADSILENTASGVTPNRMGTQMKSMADRPLPRDLDINYKAQRQYPELSPEQALMKYIEDEFDNSEKVDNTQNKEIGAIDKEVDDVEKDEQNIKTDLSKVEHDEEQIHAQINRLMQLVKLAK